MWMRLQLKFAFQNVFIPGAFFSLLYIKKEVLSITFYMSKEDFGLFVPW
jgi:hypothetical protein